MLLTTSTINAVVDIMQEARKNFAPKDIYFNDKTLELKMNTEADGTFHSISVKNYVEARNEKNRKGLLSWFIGSFDDGN